MVNLVEGKPLQSFCGMRSWQGKAGRQTLCKKEDSPATGGEESCPKNEREREVGGD